MSDMKETDKTKTEQEMHDAPANGVAGPEDEHRPLESNLRVRLRTLLSSLQPRQATKADLTKDRTRSLALLIGGTVGAVLLFIGVFSTSSRSPVQETATRNAPNLGRPALGNQSTPAQGSVTPLLNADVHSNDIASDQLSPADIRGTSRRSSESDEIHSEAEPANVNAGARPSRRQARNSEPVNALPTERSDPLAAYRLNPITGTPTYSYGGPPASPAAAAVPRTSSYGAGFGPNDSPISPGSVKSSIVFVRASTAAGAGTNTRQAATTPFTQTLLLQPGTRLIARLEAAATTAVKTPVVASIEYNYEREGTVIIPAGTKAIGDVQQASTEGYLSIRFHTLQMPNGREEKIEGTAVALDQKPLKGDVSGKNTGKKVLSRTLSGVGTIAAYVVGGGGGLNGTITGETLLRDRLAGNIALAGEQELLNAAYSQNISVTVPANTRFYVVLQKAVVEATTPPPAGVAVPAAQALQIPSVQELRELMELRREINRMYQESNAAGRPQE
jgi:hypothetical protein